MTARREMPRLGDKDICSFNGGTVLVDVVDSSEVCSFCGGSVDDSGGEDGGTTPQLCWSAVAKACTLSKRAFGSLARALSTTASTATGMAGTCSRKGGG